MVKVLHSCSPFTYIPHTYLQPPVRFETNEWTYFLLLSVRVMPWLETLKWTTVVLGGGWDSKVTLIALAIAWGPVKDSVSTVFMKTTLHAEMTEINAYYDFADMKFQIMPERRHADMINRKKILAWYSVTRTLLWRILFIHYVSDAFGAREYQNILLNTFKAWKHRLQ